MNTNDPDTENCFFHSSFFCVSYNWLELDMSAAVAVEGGKAGWLKGGFAF